MGEEVLEQRSPTATSELPRRELLRLMIEAREADRREGILMRQGRGWFQIPGMGHEALGAVAYRLRPDDVIVPHYRDRALMMARGVTARALARDFLARDGSSSAGRNLPAHFNDRDRNVFSVASPVGSQCLPAAGIAWAARLDGDDRVVLCTIGDGSTRQGEFYEAVCFAVQERLPIVFLVEDNGYSISTPQDRMTPLRLGIFGEGLVEEVDGRDAEALFDRAGAAIERARSGEGPSILWCHLDRLGSHTSADDQRVYRPKEELEAMVGRDPIDRLAERLAAHGELDAAERRQMEESAKGSMDALYKEVLEEPLPPTARVLDHLWGEDPGPDGPPPLPAPADERPTMVEAMNRTFAAGLERHPEILMFGQDVEDPKGGVFGFTRGLSDAHPGRVINSPLAEASIVGLAVGLAAIGRRPVFEIQFVDFLTPGFHQLTSQAATLRWRSDGSWSCPMVIYAPYGAYLPGGGMWHSQANDGWWAHTPGLRVAVPSTPEDAAGLFWSSFSGVDPTLILIPKHLCRVRTEVTEWESVPFGEARIRRPGDDVTVVAWGSCVELAEKAAESFAAEGVSLEVIDPRTLVPCDWQAIERSLTKTGRLVVIHEDNRTCGFGQAVAAEMTTVSRRFDQLLSPPQVVARRDVHVPFCPTLEYAVLPSLEEVEEAVRRTLV